MINTYSGIDLGTSGAKCLLVAAADTIPAENMWSYFGFCFCKNRMEPTFGGEMGCYFDFDCASAFCTDIVRGLKRE